MSRSRRKANASSRDSDRRHDAVHQPMTSTTGAVAQRAHPGEAVTLEEWQRGEAVRAARRGEWRDLGDDELASRLLYRLSCDHADCIERLARLVANRDQPEAAREIDAALGIERMDRNG